jgi:hypothetical protein
VRARCLAGFRARAQNHPAILERYQQALGGADTIKKVQSETRRGELEGGGIQGKATFVAYSKPFKWPSKVTMSNGEHRVNGLDGPVTRTTGPKGAEIGMSIPLESGAPGRRSVSAEDSTVDGASLDLQKG